MGKCLKTVAIVTVMLTGMLSLAPIAHCGNYPEKPIRLIVPFGPGGSTDLAARIMAGNIAEFLGQPVIVSNMVGAGGTICFEYIRNAKPDGYTIMMSAIGPNMLSIAINTTLPFKWDELTYIAQLEVSPGITAVAKDSPIKDLAGLKEYITTNNGKVRYGTAGVGSISHILPITIMEAMDLPASAIVPIHYDSESNAMMAMIQGEVDFCQGNLPSFIGGLEGGLIRALAFTSDERVEKFKNVPTFKELGYPTINVTGWRGVASPPGTPKEVVDVWNAAVQKMMKSKAWLKMVASINDIPAYMGPEQQTQLIADQYDRFHNLFTRLGILIKN